MNSHAATAADDALFRRVMGRFATGVTVIAARSGGAVRAMTANAFMSGSLHPPLCVVSVGIESRMHRHLVAAAGFSVSILRSDQEALSRYFAGLGPSPAAEIAFDVIAGVPALPSALARIVARKEAVHPCGDHDLFLGRVEHLDLGPGEPLLYADGRYGAFRPAPARAPTGEEVW